MAFPIPFITCQHCEADQQVENTLRRYVGGIEFQCQRCDEVIMTADAQMPSQGSDVHIDIKSSMS